MGNLDGKLLGKGDFTAWYEEEMEKSDEWYKENYLTMRYMNVDECNELYKSLIQAHDRRLFDRVEEAMEDNTKETLWGDEDSNEVMEISVKNYKKVVLTTLKDELK